jgi:putative copper resistance protein D
MGSAVTAYVRFADWAWGLIAVSGVLAAWQQLGGSAGIRTAYAGLVAVKLVVLAVVGAFGARHRRRVLPSVAAGDRAALVRGVALELLAAALAIGLSGALAATDPPAATATVAADLASVAGR